MSHPISELSQRDTVLFFSQPMSATYSWGRLQVSIGDHKTKHADIDAVVERALFHVKEMIGTRQYVDAQALSLRVEHLSNTILSARNEMWSVTRWIVSLFSSFFGAPCEKVHTLSAEASMYAQAAERCTLSSKSAFLGRVYTAAREDAEKSENAERIEEMDNDPQWAENNLHTEHVTVAHLKAALSEAR